MRRERGMALLPALFVLVFVASLVAFAVRIGSVERQTVNYALLGDRAVAAANAGIEWGRVRAAGGNCVLGPTTIQLNQAALRGFNVQVICHPTPAGIIDIEARSQWNTFGSAEYVSRRVRRQF